MYTSETKTNLVFIIYRIGVFTQNLKVRLSIYRKKKGETQKRGVKVFSIK